MAYEGRAPSMVNLEGQKDDLASVLDESLSNLFR